MLSYKVPWKIFRFNVIMIELKYRLEKISFQIYGLHVKEVSSRRSRETNKQIRLICHDVLH